MRARRSTTSVKAEQRKRAKENGTTPPPRAKGGYRKNRSLTGQVEKHYESLRRTIAEAQARSAWLQELDDNDLRAPIGIERCSLARVFEYYGRTPTKKIVLQERREG